MNFSIFKSARFGALLAVGVSGLISASIASADTWPSKPIKYVVPFAPGGVTDATSRIIAEGLSKRLGQPVIVENRPGVSGVVGTQVVAQAQPDGYTLIGGTITTHAVNPFFIKKLGYDPVKDFAPVNLVGRVSNVLVVPANSRFQSVRQLIDAIKSKPDEFTYGSGGAGSSQHLSAQLFQSITGTKLRQVSYKGGAAAMTDLLGGHIDMVFETVAAARPMLDSQRVKALGVTSAQSLGSLPGVAPLAEQGVPGFEMQSWQGVFAPAGTPKPIVDRLGKEIAAVVAMPEVQQRMRTLGVEPEGKLPEEFAAFQRDEIVKWTKVVKEAGIQAE